MSETRESQGLFTKGRSGNPSGRPRGATPSKTLERLIATNGAELFARAFERAKHDDAVLAAVINLVAAAEMSSAVQQFGLASAQAQGGTN